MSSSSYFLKHYRLFLGFFITEVENNLDAQNYGLKISVKILLFVYIGTFSICLFFLKIEIEMKFIQGDLGIRSRTGS
jgi:hypothetical protein